MSISKQHEKTCPKAKNPWLELCVQSRAGWLEPGKGCWSPWLLVGILFLGFLMQSALCELPENFLCSMQLPWCLSCQ